MSHVLMIGGFTPRNTELLRVLLGTMDVEGALSGKPRIILGLMALNFACLQNRERETKWIDRRCTEVRTQEPTVFAKCSDVGFIEVPALQ